MVDSAGQLFGHIVAGDPMLGLAFIIPAYKIFDDIKSRFGEEPLLCPSTSVVQPYSAPNDGEVAEQPLLDLIKCKGTGAMIHRRGFSAVGTTVPVEVVGPHARRHITSFWWGHLVEAVTKLKEIAEMMLKREAANGTLLERVAHFLQNMVQKVPEGRMAFFQGDPSGSFLIVIDASDELMLATFSATTESPPFASILSSISAYNHINHANCLTSEAAKVCKYSPKKSITS